MKDAQKPDHIGLNNLIIRLKEGRFVIPDFQREFEWKPWDILALMRSIFLDYYIGSFLLWKGRDDSFEALACEPVYGHDGGKNNCEHIVLDGQQRLTAMYYTFLAPDIPLPNRAKRFLYFIRVDRFMEEFYDEAFEYDWRQRSKNLEKDRDAQFEQHVFFLSIIGKGGFELPNWLQDYARYWENKATAASDSGDVEAEELAKRNAENARAFGEHVRDIMEQYQVAYIELDRNIEVDKVCDIFTQINSKGIQLDIFDLINALLKPKGLQLKYLWRQAKDRLSFFETSKMNVYILQVMSILQQNYCSPKYLYFLLPGQDKIVRNKDGSFRKEVLIPTVEDFEKQWEVAIESLENSIKMLRHPQEFGAVNPNYLPYYSILPAFAALQHHVNSLPSNRRLDAQRKVRHWYWASVFTNRYSGSVESKSARDFLDLKKWIEDSNAEPAPIQEFNLGFKNLDLRNEIKRGSSIYNGIFNLLVIKGARDWMTGNVPQYDDLDDHHIVPASWGSKNLGNNKIHTILNRTPLTTETNRKVIKKRLPNQYLPELIQSNGETTVRAILESHFISSNALDILLRDPFTPNDYEDFIAERQRTIQDAIENLLVKERLDLPPQIRELDEKIEKIELGLRNVIVDVLEGDADAIPPHVAQKVNDRINQAAKKNPALDIELYKKLEGKLEFFDLRELQETITGKTLWPRFADRFGNKETMVGKLDRLAELRNGIRHSRTVDEVARKEGEAAIIWFEKLLKG
ncbi:MAG: DUF262 domain-containing protein [bacterium]